VFPLEHYWQMPTALGARLAGRPLGDLASGESGHSLASTTNVGDPNLNAKLDGVINLHEAQTS
jgi:hypothetical protein